MINTTGKCSVCGQTVGIDTIHTCSPQAPRPRVSEHTDAARLEALRDSMRPRVEGERVKYFISCAQAWDPRDRLIGNATAAECAGIGYDLLEARAEVARLRGVVRDAYYEGMEDEARQVANWRQSEAFAALSLPTPAPEATE